MNAESLARWVEAAAGGIELVAVALLVAYIVAGTVGYLRATLTRRDVHDYERFRRRLGRALLLGLEILVAADIIRTVGVGPTLPNITSLGVLVLIRTFLSWSVVVELEGRWPWQIRTGPPAE